MSDDELCDAMRTLLLAGHDTTASTLTWLLERLSRHPQALSRTEAAALDGDDDYLDAVIKEAMRLRPVGPMTVRLAAQDFELPGLTVPAGTIVVPYITLVQRRADLWEDPLEFRPERFLNTTVSTYAWIPFGGGRRRCLGAAFSLIEARVVLRTILRAARLAPNSATVGTHQPEATCSSCPGAAGLSDSTAAHLNASTPTPLHIAFRAARQTRRVTVASNPTEPDRSPHETTISRSGRKATNGK